MIRILSFIYQASPHAQLPDTDSQDLNPNTGNSPGLKVTLPFLRM